MKMKGRSSRGRKRREGGGKAGGGVGARQGGGISSACIYAKYMRHQQKRGALSQPFAGPRRILKHIEAKPIKNECHAIITFTLKI